MGPFVRCDGLCIIRSGDVADGVVILQFTLFPSKRVWLHVVWLNISASEINQNWRHLNNQFYVRHLLVWSFNSIIGEKNVLFPVIVVCGGCRFWRTLSCPFCSCACILFRISVDLKTIKLICYLLISYFLHEGKQFVG